MILEFDASFLKCIRKNRDTSLHAKIEQILLECEQANGIEDLRNCKKLTGFASYFRIRVGDYRLGFEKVDNTTLRFIALAHRKEIYKNFP